MGIQAICPKIVKNYCNNCQIPFFTHLLALFLAGRPPYYLRVSLIGLAIDLTIAGTVSIVEEVIVDLSEWSLENERIIFLRY